MVSFLEIICGKNDTQFLITIKIHANAQYCAIENLMKINEMEKFMADIHIKIPAINLLYCKVNYKVDFVISNFSIAFSTSFSKKAKYSSCVAARFSEKFHRPVEIIES